MRKLFNEFFYVSKHEKIREKVIVARLTVTITIVIMCLMALSFTAYAYFSYNITSKSNVIKSADFEAKISIQLMDTNGNIVETVNPITSNYKTFKVSDLKPNEYYTITIVPTEKNTANTGFVIVSADGCDKTYHTQQLGVDENVIGGKTPSISFKLMTTNRTNVVFRTHWGTSVYYSNYNTKEKNNELYITQNEEIKMVISGETTQTQTPPANDNKTNENNPNTNTVPDNSQVENISTTPELTSEPSTTIPSSLDTENTTTQPPVESEVEPETSTETTAFE